LYILKLLINRSENIKFYFNKTLLQSIASSWSGAYSSSDLYIGCKGGGTALFPNANYLEIIIYDRVITDKERIAIEEYLSKKWGNFN